MIKSLRDSKIIKRFSFTGHHSNKNVYKIIDTIKNNDVITSLTMGITFYFRKEKIVRYMADYIGVTTSLQCLDLSSSIFTFADICESLRINNTIRTLKIKQCRMNYDDLVCIHEMLVKNTFITELDLSDNNFGDHTLIASILAINTTLKILDLQSNQMTYNEIQLLANSLSINIGLESINLSNCAITDDGMLSIIDALQNNYCLADLTIDKVSNLSIKELLDRNINIKNNNRFVKTKAIIENINQ